MTNEQIARWGLYRLQILADKQLKQEQFETQALAIIADAVAAGRREGECAGIRTGVQQACEAQAFVLNQCFLKPISAAETAKAEEPS